MSDPELFPAPSEPRLPLIQVAPDVPVAGPFTYSVPPALAARARAGVRVRVPFGGRTVVGFVVADEAPPLPAGTRTRAVQEVLDDEPLLTADVLGLARWAAAYYHAPLGEVLAAAVPGDVARPPDPPRWVVAAAAPTGRVGAAQARVLAALDGGALPLEELRRVAGLDAATLRRLEARGLVRVEARPPGAAEAGPRDAPPELTPEQADALAGLVAQLEGRRPRRPTLLFGVTGSGKTEVYLRAIARAFELGRGAIVLVPEIALTPQTLERFRARFGAGVAVLHSQLSGRDRREEWWRVRRGEARVVIGPRSAVWAPVEGLGLLVVDEEHETTYKQESSPRYHARDLAVVRAAQADIPVLLGSATPSLESWWNACRGRYALARLRSRPAGSALPRVTVVDTAREWAEVKGAPLLSRSLVRELEGALGRGERALLFQNRRGFTTYLQCPSCGHVVKCDQCDVTLTWHRAGDALVCHFCDARRPPPRGGCPACLGGPLRQRGAGTERIEEVVQQRFAGVTVGRLDTDVVREGAPVGEVLERFRSGAVQVLVGTQMIAKGLDIPEVTVVGVISADTSLALPDFRAVERTFQLVAQVAGRSGRGTRPGCTVIQTFVPTHYAIQAAAEHRFEAFAERELEARRALGYPPFARLLKILFRGPDEAQVRAEAERVIEALRRDLGPTPGGEAGAGRLHAVLGPAPSPRAYLSGKFRWQALVKAGADGIQAAARALGAVRTAGKVELVLDVDPYDLM